jgi:O-antigen/teichoic acid export membrane protein
VLNRAILLDVAGADAVGRFSVALRFASVVGLIGGAFLLAWQPRAYASGKSVRSLGRVANETAAFVMVGGAVVIALTAMAPVLVVLFAGQSYGRASDLIGALAIAALGATAVQLFSLGSTLVRRSVDLSVSLLFSALIGFGINVATVSSWGEYGTVLAIAAGQAIGLVVTTVLARRRTIVPYDFGWLAVGAVVTLSAVAVLSFVNLGSAPRAVVAGLSIGSLALVASGIQRQSEKRALVSPRIGDD